MKKRDDGALGNAGAIPEAKNPRFLTKYGWWRVVGTVVLAT